MKFAWIIAYVLICSTATLAQSLKINPEKPSVTDSILIEYDPSFFGSNATSIQCRVYFSGVGSGESDFLRVTIISLTKEGNTLKGSITVPVQANGMVITFSDSLGERDNNNRKGYWSLLYENENPVPGSWAGVGDLLYGRWDKSLFHLGENTDSTWIFFQRDLKHNPEIKKVYMRQYLASFKTGTAETDQALKKELTYFSNLPSLTESNLLALRDNYRRLNDTLNANQSEREIFKRFPEGSWTPQAKSLPLLIRVGSSKDFNEQAKAYQEFKKSFLKPYENAFATRTMNLRAARMLAYMVNHFSNEGTLDVWKKEVDQLTDAGKLSAYQGGSRKLIEKAGEIKSSSQQIENKFYQFNLTPDQRLKDAEDLATIAVELWRKKASNPIQERESGISTRDEVIQFRNDELSDLMMLLGTSLLRQNKISEAVTALKEGVEKSNYSQPETNELYIEALVKSGELNVALSEIQKIISLNKSTPALDRFYADATKGKDDLKSLRQENLEKAKSLMEQKLTLEKCPNFTVLDLSGKSISSKSLKNKIFVISFWASWCAPCIIELKSIDALVKKYENDSEIVFLSVNEDESRERAMRIINQYKSQKHFMFDQKRKMVYEFGVSGLPTLVIIDRSGDLRFRTSGLTTFNEQENTVALEAMIEVLKSQKQ